MKEMLEFCLKGGIRGSRFLHENWQQKAPPSGMEESAFEGKSFGKSLFFLIHVPELIEDDDRGSHADCNIGHIECGPVPVSPVEVEEVDHVPGSHPVAEVSERSRADEREGEAEEKPCVVAPEHSEHHKDDDERKGGEHQPPISARNEKAAP